MTFSLRSPALRRGVRVAAALTLAYGAGLLAATTPTSGTLSAGDPPLTFTGGPYYRSAAGGCDPSLAPCDRYELTVDLPADYATTHPGDRITFDLTWNPQQTDFDMKVYDEAGNDISGGAGGNSPGTPEHIEISAVAGKYSVEVIPYAPGGSTVTGTITLVTHSVSEPPVGPPAQGPGVPRFYDYAPPAGVGENAGEPSVGYNLATGHGMFLAGLNTLQITFPERIAPEGETPEACEAIWSDVSTTLTHTKSLDPILFTDQYTGRTFVSQLNTTVVAGKVGPGLNSLMAYTDDDGANWTAAQANPPDTTNDHQSVGAGPYPASVDLSNPTNKGSAVYYCAQGGVALVVTAAAYCSRSDDGGLNFGKGTQVYNGAVTCDTGSSQMIHGHVRVAPDGTVYLPNSRCSAKQIVAVSTDAGTTWAIRHIADSISPDAILDPSVAISKDPPVAPATSNTIYVCYTGLVPGGNATDNHPFVAVSKDRGLTWAGPYDIGASLGIKNAVFAEAVAGDADRAACAFIGTTQTGDHQGSSFKGTWYGFVAYTYDGGANWSTVNATNTPVQREACIWNSGGSSTCRNLLDFNEITMDEKGRVVFGYADGCINECETGGANSFSSKGTVARQSGGKGLLAAFDPVEPAKPQRACLSGRRDDIASYLSWHAPDNGGSQIAGYKVFRGIAKGSETLIGQIGVKTNYNDRSVSPDVEKYYYKVTAINGLGEGLYSNTIELVQKPRLAPLDACSLPGLQAVSDPTGDESDGQTAHDITSVSMAELPSDSAGHASNVAFTIKVADLATIPPGFRWAVRFSVEGVTPPTDASGGASEDFFVSMVTSDNAAPAFTWGVTSVPQGAARVFSTKGNLDPGSNAAADGAITLILPKSAIGDPAPGTGIVGMLGSVRATAPSALPGTGGTNETIPDSTGGGSYTLRADNLCLANSAPVARLIADKQEGTRPLTVEFDGGDSTDADTSIDTIESYTFNFDDGGGDVIQQCDSANPGACKVITHTFADDGIYRVKLVVHDSRGKASDNVAQVLIFVGASDPDLFAPRGFDNNKLGGAMAVVGLSALGVAGLLRRRRQGVRRSDRN